MSHTQKGNFFFFLHKVGSKLRETKMSNIEWEVL